MYRFTKVLNINGTHRLEYDIKDLVGRDCIVGHVLEPDLCAIFFVKDDEGIELPIVTSPVRTVSGTRNKTNLVIKTQFTIYELEWIGEEES